MDNNLENLLDEFNQEESVENVTNFSDKKVIKNNDGLIEMVDKVFITESGKRLLCD